MCFLLNISLSAAEWAQLSSGLTQLFERRERKKEKVSVISEWY